MAIQPQTVVSKPEMPIYIERWLCQRTIIFGLNIYYAVKGKTRSRLMWLRAR